MITSCHRLSLLRNSFFNRS